MWEKIAAHTVAVFTGVFLGFFLVVAPLFADSGTALEYLISLFILDLIFFLAGFMFCFFLPNYRTSISLTIPVILMVLVLALFDRPDEFFHIMIFIVFPLVAVVAALGGCLLGPWVKSKWNSRMDRSSH